MKNLASFYWRVIAVVCILSMNAMAHPLGTLFFSPEERSTAHLAAGEVKASGRVIHVNGLIQVRHHPNKLLVNGLWIGEGGPLPSGVVINSAGRHQVRITDTERYPGSRHPEHVLKIGQQLDMGTGSTREGASGVDNAQLPTP